MKYWMIYLFTFMLLFVQNRMIVLVSSQKPRIFRTPGGVMILNLFTTIARYGSAYLIYTHHGLIISAIALLVSYLYSHVVFKFFFKQQVYRVMPICYEQAIKEITNERLKASITSDFNTDDPKNLEIMLAKAKSMAEELVIATMKGL